MIRSWFLMLALTLVQTGAKPVTATTGSNAADTEPSTPIRHIIVLMQENHTFDNYFGTYPGADGIPPDTCIPVDPFDPRRTECVEPFHIGERSAQDLDHSRRTFQLQHNEGRMDGFVFALNRLNQDGSLALGYYDDRDLPYYWNLADEYVLFDRFFSSAAAGSFMNHVYWVTASPGNGGDRPTLDGLDDMPTIFDRLEEKGLSWKFYIQKYDPNLTYRSLVEGAPRPPQVEWVPLLSMSRYVDDSALFSHIVELDAYYEDLRRGTLPAVSYIKILGATEHPPGNLLSGQRATRSLVQALMQSDAWDSTAFILTYDDWGGWYDHVPPPRVDQYGYGFRVPTLLVSPYAKSGHIDSTTLDYTSILKFIEENWDLLPLTARDASANNLTGAFDFDQSPRKPRLTPSQRYVGEEEKEANTFIIYGAYGASLMIATIIFIWAFVVGRRYFIGPKMTQSQERAK